MSIKTLFRKLKIINEKMKISAIISLSIIFVGCSGSASSSGSIDLSKPLSELTFPDAALQQCVSNSGAVTVATLKSLDCGGLGIVNTEGLEQLEALEKLNLSNNQFNTIDLSANADINDINLEGNTITCANVQYLKNRFRDFYWAAWNKVDIDCMPETVNSALLDVLQVPDPVLAQCIVDTGKESIEELTELTCNGQENKKVEDLTGIEALTALKHLNLIDNQLDSVDISMYPALEDLRLTGNNFMALDVTFNTALVQLSLEGNQITTIDLKNNSKLEHLYLNHNQLTQIDVSHNPLLTHFWVLLNQLSEIDLTNNIHLEALSLADNPITQLDISNNPAIWLLILDGTLLTCETLESIKVQVPGFNFEKSCQ